MSAIYARPAAGSPLSDAHPGESTGDHQPLDLTRPLEDRVNGRISMYDLRDGRV